MAFELLICGIAVLAVVGVMVRPFEPPEAVWPFAGVELLMLLHLLPAADALAGVSNGIDVYLFLTGMLLLSETAREGGLFTWLAASRRDMPAVLHHDYFSCYTVSEHSLRSSFPMMRRPWCSRPHCRHHADRESRPPPCPIC